MHCLSEFLSTSFLITLPVIIHFLIILNTLDSFNNELLRYSNSHHLQSSTVLLTIVGVEVIRCIKRENAWIKCKVQSIYI